MCTLFKMWRATTDAWGRVIHQRHHPIVGLYASGTVAATTERGIGYRPVCRSRWR
jgi:hypothetical protein